MIIDQLPLLQGNPIDDDEFPVERGTTTYKTKLLALAAAVLGKLVKDATPAEGSANPVESGGVYAALQTKQDQIIDSGILKGNGSSVSAATLGADYTAVDDTLESSATKTYSIDKIKSLEPTGLVSYAEAQTLTESEKKQARENIEAAHKWQTIWTNANPTSAFAAQTVPADLSTFTEIMVVFTTTLTTQRCSLIIPTDSTEEWPIYNFGNMSSASSAVTVCKRSVQIVSGGVLFTDTDSRATAPASSAHSTRNDVSIPQMIKAR